MYDEKHVLLFCFSLWNIRFFTKRVVAYKELWQNGSRYQLLHRISLQIKPVINKIQRKDDNPTKDARTNDDNDDEVPRPLAGPSDGILQ